MRHTQLVNRIEVLISTFVRFLSLEAMLELVLKVDRVCETCPTGHEDDHDTRISDSQFPQHDKRKK